jgi:hypothetical protein
MVVLFLSGAEPMLTGCWQQGAATSGTTIEGDLSMMILCELGNYQPLWRLQTWMLERLIAAQLGSADLRWGMIALAVNLLAAAWASGRRRFVSPGPGRASGRQNPADTMLAAGFR